MGNEPLGTCMHHPMVSLQLTLHLRCTEMNQYLSLVAKYEAHDPYSVAFLIKKHVFKWYVVWCGFKNKYQKEICS